MTTLPDINLLTGKQIEDVLKTCDSYLGKKLGLEGAVENTKFPIIVSSLNLTWNSVDDFEKDINLLAKKNNIRSAYSTLYKEWEQKLVQEKSERVEKTTLTPEEAEKLEAEAEKRRTEAKESTETAQRKQEQWLKLQKEKLPKPLSKEEQEKVLAELKGKVVYAVPQKPEPEIALTKEEQSFANLAKQNPRVFEQMLAEDIVKKNPEIFKSEELKPLADVISADATKTFIDPTQKPIPTGIFAALANYKGSPEIQKTGILFTLISEERQNLYREILNRTVGINLTNKTLGFPETTYEFSQTPPDKLEGSFSLKLDTLQANSFALQESPLFQTLDNPLLGEAKTAISGQLKDFAFSKIASLPKEGLLGKISQFTTSRSFDSIAPFLGLPTQMAYTGTTFFGKMITTFLPEYAPLITNFSAKFGIDIGIKALAPVAGKTIEAGVVGGLAGKVAAKLGLSAALANVLGALGSFAPIIGNIIGFVVGWLLGKIIEPILNWIKKHQEDLKIVGLIMLGGGMVMRSLSLMVMGGLIFAPIALRSGFSMAGAAARTFWFFGRLGRSMAITIGTPIIIAIIVFPILVAIILFIINSGAYIVPPTTSGPIVESPYIRVDKVSSPAGPFPNTALPLTIEYTITVTAKKGALSNISFSENCQVIKRGPAVDCPTVSHNIPPPPVSTSPTVPFSFKYSVTYAASTYVDSLVVNSFTVTASTAGISGVKGVGSTSIKIGNPPEDCPNNAWPVEDNGGLNAVTQGPSAPGCTHQNLNNAIDIGVDGATVVAAHSGIVTVGEDSCTGKTVKVSSTCGSVPFSSFYAHLGAVTVSTGQKVSVGQAIGISDNTGSCTRGAHLHFSFQTSSIPTVQKPYLARDIPIGCCSISTCNP